MVKTTEAENDNFFLYMAHQMQGIQPLLKSFFGFLERKTDFYEATPDKTEFMILNIYREFYLIHQKKTIHTCGIANEFGHIGGIEAASIEEIEPEKKDYESDRLEANDSKCDVKSQKSADETVQEIGQECEDREKAENVTKKAIKRVEWELSRLTKKGSAYPNEGDGASYPGYKWTQTPTELEVQVPLYDYSEKIRSNLKASFDRKSIKITSGLGLEEEVIFGGDLYEEIRTRELTWTVEDQMLVIRTVKVQKEWWKKLLVDEPNILINKVLKKYSTIGDMDEETKRGFQETIMRKKEYAERMHNEQFPDRLPLPDHLKDKPDSPK